MSRKKQNSLNSFLVNLRSLCDACPREVGRWNREGTQFQVDDAVGFFALAKVYYTASTHGTFFRQLNLYQFQSLKRLREGWFHFSHEMFLRDDPGKIYKIKRVVRSRKSNGSPYSLSDKSSQHDDDLPFVDVDFLEEDTEPPFVDGVADVIQAHTPRGDTEPQQANDADLPCFDDMLDMELLGSPASETWLSFDDVVY